MIENKLRERFLNWGCWLLHDADIGPRPARCISIESRHVPDAGDVWEEDRCSDPVPDVADAEALHRSIVGLDRMNQHCLARRYGGIPSVFRFIRISDAVLDKLADNAETLIQETLKIPVDKWRNGAQPTR